MLEEKVRSMVAVKFKVDQSNLGFETHVFNDLGADSLEMLSFITELEKEFNVEVHEKAIDQLYSVSKIMEFLENSS